MGIHLGRSEVVWNRVLGALWRPPVNDSSSDGWSSCVIALEIPTQSASLHYRAYADHVGGRTVLEWAVQRFRHITADASRICILTDTAERQRVEAALKADCRPTITLRSGRGDFHDLHELSRGGSESRLLYVDLTAALLPAHILDKYLRCHIERRSHATSLLGVPCSVVPYLIDTGMLPVLKSVPGLSWSCRIALNAMEQAGNSVRWAAFRVRVSHVKASVYSDASGRWPHAVALRNKEEISTLDRVLNQTLIGESTTEPTDLLDDWTDVSCQIAKEEFSAVGNSVRGRSAPSAHPVPGRILYAQSPSAFTGVEQVMLLLADGVRRECPTKYECVALIGKSGILTDRLASLGLNVSIANRDFAVSSVRNYVFSLHELRRIAPAIVHAHTVTGVPFCSAVVQGGIPLVQHVHVAEPAGLIALREQLLVATAVVAVSEFVKARLIRHGVDPSKIQVIHNGTQVFEPMLESRSSVLRSCGVPDTAKIILFVGRFAPKKRHDVAVEAFARLYGRCSDSYLLLAGETFDGHQQTLEAVQSQLDRLHVRDRVRCLGFWPNMPRLYSVADIVILPAEDEALPMTVLEAMAAGVAVVGARSGGTPEMIIDGKSGLLVRPGCADAFAAAIESVLVHDELRARLVSEARETCRRHFNLTRCVAQVASLYDELLSDDSGR